MKNLIAMMVMALVLGCGVPEKSFAAQTWIMLGDSIMSGVSPSVLNGPAGTSVQMATHIIERDRNIIIRNLSSPGHSLAATDHTGFGNIVPSLKNIGGFWSAYNGIIIQAGTNDFSRSSKWEDEVVSLRLILNHAKTMKKKVLMMGIPYRDDWQTLNALGYDLNTYRFFAYLVCVEFPGTCFYGTMDGQTTLAVRTPSLYDPAEVAQGKALHLNAAGHAEFARWVKAQAAIHNLF